MNPFYWAAHKNFAVLVDLPNAHIKHAEAFNDDCFLKQLNAINKRGYFLEEFFSQQKFYFLWQPKNAI